MCATSVIVSSFQRGEGDERRRTGLTSNLVRIPVALRRLEDRKSSAQLTVLVAKLPVGFGEPFEPFRGASGPNERRECKGNSGAGKQPLEGQQNSYLIERLATVSTACHNTRRAAR
jgi:hypothetical protein